MHVRTIARRKQPLLSAKERSPEATASVTNGSWRSGRMYAIAFDLDTEAAKREFAGGDHTQAWHAFRKVLEEHGFTNKQGSVYFGREGTTPVHCVLAVQDASRRHAWLRRVVRDIRMLRIEENNDLFPALGAELPFDPPLPVT